MRPSLQSPNRAIDMRWTYLDYASAYELASLVEPTREASYGRAHPSRMRSDVYLGDLDYERNIDAFLNLSLEAKRSRIGIMGLVSLCRCGLISEAEVRLFTTTKIGLRSNVGRSVFSDYDALNRWFRWKAVVTFVQMGMVRNVDDRHAIDVTSWWQVHTFRTRVRPEIVSRIMAIRCAYVLAISDPTMSAALGYALSAIEPSDEVLFWRTFGCRVITSEFPNLNRFNRTHLGRIAQSRNVIAKLDFLYHQGLICPPQILGVLFAAYNAFGSLRGCDLGNWIVSRRVRFGGYAVPLGILRGVRGADTWDETTITDGGRNAWCVFQNAQLPTMVVHEATLARNATTKLRRLLDRDGDHAIAGRVLRCLI